MRTVFLRTLGIQYTGVSSLFTDILTVLSFAELGISSAITYALYKPVAEKDSERVASLMRFYRSAYRVVSLIVLIGGLCVVPFLDIIVKKVPDIKEPIVLIYILYVINTAVSYLFVFKSTLFTANQEHHYVSRIQIIISLTRSAVECLLLFVFHNFLVYLIFGICITWLQNILISISADKHYPEFKSKHGKPLSKEERSGLFKNVGALMMYKVSNSLMNGCDSVIISSFIGTGWVGYISNYTLVTSKVNNLMNQFYHSATPSVGNLAVTDTERQYSTFKILQFMSFWMTTFCATSFIVLLNPFIEICFGAEYVRSMVIVVVLTTHFFLNSLVHPVATFRNANGLFVQGKFRPVAMCIINIGLSVVLALWWRQSGELWGVFGVKLATVIAQLLTIQWFDPYLVYKRVFKQSLKKYYKKFFVYLSFAVCSCFATWSAGHVFDTYLSLNPYIVFAIKLVLCLLVPNLFIFLLFRKTEEYVGFMDVLKKLLGKKRAKKKTAEISG